MSPTKLFLNPVNESPEWPTLSDSAFAAIIDSIGARATCEADRTNRARHQIAQIVWTARLAVRRQAGSVQATDFRSVLDRMADPANLLSQRLASLYETNDPNTAQVRARAFLEDALPGVHVSQLRFLLADLAEALREVDGMKIGAGAKRKNVFLNCAVPLLAKVYKELTGRVPGKGTDPKTGGPSGPFAKFVEAVMTQFGEPRAQNPSTWRTQLNSALGPEKPVRARATRQKNRSKKKKGCKPI